MKAALVLLVLLCGCLVPACGASQATRDAYLSETRRCEANEAAILARPDTTLDEDREALRLERLRCDRARAGIAP